MTRSEDMAASNPAGAEMMTVELGADAEGNLTGIRTRILVDRGSTDDFGVESIAALLSAGPYRWQAHQLTALGVSTNRMTFGAYRAPTAPPAAFAVESLIDELARRLDMDPLELRLRNVVGEGDANPAGQPFPIFGARQCLERIRDHPLWSRRQELPDGEGIGAAIGWWPGGYEPAAAVCRLDADGNLTIITGAADMSGVESGFATIAAEAFGVDPDRVRVVRADTSSAPYAGTSGGSKVTYTVGRAVERAASEARERLLEIAAEELEIAPEDLEIVNGAIQPAGVPAKALPIDELAPKILSFGGKYPPVEGHGRVALPPRAPVRRPPVARPRRPRHGRGDAACPRRRAGRRTGAEPRARRGPDARRHHAGPRLGAARGARARRPRPAHDRDVRRLRPADRRRSCRRSTPRSSRCPSPEGPYGAKGVGEAPVVGAPGAVANAVAAATGGRRVWDLPMTPSGCGAR